MARIGVKGPPRAKFGNVKTVVDGITFHSKREAKRWGELRLLEQAGAISQLTRQVRIPVVVNGHKVCYYVADFVYHENGKQVVEDCKGFRTDTYKLKKKLVFAACDIDIRET